MNKVIQLKDQNGFVYPISEIYSTEEQIIGSWINEKPIYRKAIHGSTGSGTIDTIALPNNFENIVKLSGFIVGSDGFTNTIPMFWNDTFKIIAQIKSGMLYLNYGDAFRNQLYIVIVEYTKTTD